MAGKPENDDAQEKNPLIIPIRDFADLRSLRKSYLQRNEKPIGIDSNNHPIADEQEEDFGLKRSTVDEALQFYRDSLSGDEANDSLSEFLNDE
ncbi:MAG: hypothetical protein LBS30_05680 [Planctomycetota bacterium]|jgi:hypothetical protein|nr:hypothetical protein [Planctomycetota bacterium]